MFCGEDQNIFMKLCEVWVPRQDQLQDILMMKFSQMEVIAHFWEEVVAGALVGTTFEQLWLEVTMKYMYNKAWHEDDWIVIE